MVKRRLNVGYGGHALVCLTKNRSQLILDLVVA
jgi:hypothetical protein